jgi:hypothetical protein
LKIKAGWKQSLKSKALKIIIRNQNLGTFIGFQSQEKSLEFNHWKATIITKGH